MQQLIFAFLLALTALPMAATTAHAQCVEMKTYSRDETRQLMSMLVAPEADPLDQLFSFEDLMCSSNPTVRNMALKAGANSSSEDVRSQILFRALAEQQIIRVELGEGRNSDGTLAKFSNGVIEMPVIAVNAVAGCISFQSPGKADCNQKHHIQLMGPGIRIFNSVRIGAWQLLRGDLAYSFGNTLEGELIFSNTTYPVTIKLF
ncbi:MAG: hypothetical protein AAGF79_11900 [Pseudomonadota bacterium]